VCVCLHVIVCMCGGMVYVRVCESSSMFLFVKYLWSSVHLFDCLVCVFA